MGKLRSVEEKMLTTVQTVMDLKRVKQIDPENIHPDLLEKCNFTYFRDNVEYTIVKGEIDNEECVVFIYKFDNESDEINKVAFTQTIMDIIKFLEHIVVGLDHKYILKDVESASSTTISILICSKKISRINPNIFKPLNAKRAAKRAKRIKND